MNDPFTKRTMATLWHNTHISIERKELKDIQICPYIKTGDDSFLASSAETPFCKKERQRKCRNTRLSNYVPISMDCIIVVICSNRKVCLKSMKGILNSPVRLNWQSLSPEERKKVKFVDCLKLNWWRIIILLDLYYRKFSTGFRYLIGIKIHTYIDR